jgi:hypothetical protein
MYVHRPPLTTTASMPQQLPVSSPNDAVLDHPSKPISRKRKSGPPRSALSQIEEHLAEHCSVLEPLDARDEGSSFSDDDSIVCVLLGLETDSEDEGDLEGNPLIAAPYHPTKQEHSIPQYASRDVQCPRSPTDVGLPRVPYKIREFDITALSTSTDARPRDADQEDHLQQQTVSFNENATITSSKAKHNAQSKHDLDTASKGGCKKHHSELYYSMMMAMFQADESTTKSASSALALTVPTEIKPEFPVGALDERGESCRSCPWSRVPCPRRSRASMINT